MSRSIFLGKDNNDDPLFHIAATDGLSSDELKTGVRPDTLFHSSLPYMMADRVEIPLSYTGTRPIIKPPWGSSYENSNWYRLALPDNVRFKMQNRVYMLLFRRSDGVYCSPSNTIYSRMDHYGVGQYANPSRPRGHMRQTRLVGDSQLGYLFHRNSEPYETYLRGAPIQNINLNPAIWTEGDASPGFDSTKNYLSVYSSWTIDAVAICFFNASYTADTFIYEPLVLSSKSILITRQAFKIGELDLANKAFLKSNGTSDAHQVGESLIRCPPNFTSNDLIQDLESIHSGSQNFGRLVGGHGTTEWSMNFDTGQIQAKKEGDYYDVFKETLDDNTRVRYDRTLSASGPSIRINLPQNHPQKYHLTHKIGSLSVPNEDSIEGLLCFLPGNTAFMAGQSLTTTSNPVNHEGQYVWFEVPSGFTSAYIRLNVGDCQPLIHAAAYTVYEYYVRFARVFRHKDQRINTWIEYSKPGVINIYCDIEFSSWTEASTSITSTFYYTYIPSFSFSFMTLK